MSLGLVLSGGGIRCVAQLAIIKSLKESGIQPTLFAGASGGALVACLISIGKDPEEVLTIVKELNLLSMLKLRLNRQGLIDINRSLEVLTKDLPATFEELPLPVTIAATNVRTGKCEYFSNGPLLPPLLASCCMPVFFFPVQIGQEVYIDAGITNNFPANAIWGKARYLLGIHTNPVSKEFQASSVKNILERTFLLTINGNVIPNKGYCHRVLEPENLKTIRVFDFKEAEKVYLETRQWLSPHILQLVQEIKQTGA